jgi:hypothetical protein
LSVLICQGRYVTKLNGYRPFLALKATPPFVYFDGLGPALSFTSEPTTYGVSVCFAKNFPDGI